MPAIGTVGKASISLRDATGESSTMSLTLGTLNAGNFAAVNTAVNTLWTATAALTLGVVASEAIGNQSILSNAEASDPAAQRENKLLITYWDVTTEKQYQVSIPTIDFSFLHFMPGAGDAVAFKTADGAPTEMTDWVTAWEAAAKAPDTGNAVAVIGARYVGRNS